MPIGKKYWRAVLCLAALLAIQWMRAPESWDSIWQRKGAPHLVPTTVDDLIAIDGFDHTAGFINIMREYASEVKLGKEDVLCDIGCGSGAFLHVLPRPKLALCVDLSENLLRVSRRYIETYAPGMRVLHLQADMTALHQISPGFCDVVVVQSVFQYLASTQAARQAVSELRRIAKHRIYIFDVRDGSKEEYTRLRASAGLTSSTPHLFIPRSFWGSGWAISEPAARTKQWQYIAPFMYHVQSSEQLVTNASSGDNAGTHRGRYGYLW